jgi:transcriptional regulator with XRE-family HTH domain
MAEPPIGAKLRTALEEKGWSYTRLIAEMRRVAGRQGKTLPTTASLIAMLSRWLNAHERPSRFYREILSGALGLDLAELEPGMAMSLQSRCPPTAPEMACLSSNIEATSTVPCWTTWMHSLMSTGAWTAGLERPTCSRISPVTSTG